MNLGVRSTSSGELAKATWKESVRNTYAVRRPVQIKEWGRAGWEVSLERFLGTMCGDTALLPSSLQVQNDNYNKMQVTLTGMNSGLSEEWDCLARGCPESSHPLLWKSLEAAERKRLGCLWACAFPLLPPVQAQAGIPESIFFPWEPLPCFFPQSSSDWQQSWKKHTCSTNPMGLYPALCKVEPPFLPLSKLKSYFSHYREEKQKVGQLASGLWSAYSRNTSR